MSEVFDLARMEQAEARLRSGARLPAFNTFTVEQIEDALHRAGHISDPHPLRRLNAVLAGCFWRENWHRGFWPLRLALR